MPTFPTTPAPLRCTMPAYTDPAYVSQYQGGAIATRSKYLRRRAMYRVDYLVTTEGLNQLADFWETTRGTVLPFVFVYPYPHINIVATDTTPVVVTTPYAHGYQTGYQVMVTNANATINGIQTVTRVTAVSFSLDGTSGGGGAADGQVARYFPTMRFSSDTFPLPEPIDGIGAGFGASGLFAINFDIEESW